MSGEARLPDGTHNLHASCVIIGECGILIRGASGAGKSSFARLLLSQARLGGMFAAWVADDRVLLRATHGRLVATPHPRIAGRCEARGLGIRSEPHEKGAILRLAVDLEGTVERFPSKDALSVKIADVALQRIPLVAGRVGLYEACLVLSVVLDLARMRQLGAAHSTSVSEVEVVSV